MSRLLTVMLLTGLASACTPVIKLWPIAKASAEPSASPSAGLANPASTYCVQNSGRIVIKDTVAGQTGYCVFRDQSSCEEWAYYRNQCQPGDHPNDF